MLDTGINHLAIGNGLTVSIQRKDGDIWYIVMHWNVTYVLMLGTVAVMVSIYVFMAIKLE